MFDPRYKITRITTSIRDPFLPDSDYSVSAEIAFTRKAAILRFIGHGMLAELIGEKDDLVKLAEAILNAKGGDDTVQAELTISVKRP